MHPALLPCLLAPSFWGESTYTRDQVPAGHFSKGFRGGRLRREEPSGILQGNEGGVGGDGGA
jgi:hypothetical protein